MVIAVAAVVSIIMRWLKQPLIMGYILTGILVGPSLLDIVHAKEAFETFADIGIALLLFIIGLGLNVGVIKSLGKVSTAAAGAILSIIGTLGFVASLLLGFDLTTAFLLGIAMFFSSTIIILKVLSDRHETNRLYGQIAIGVILVDDIVATIALVVVAMMAANETSATAFMILGLKAIALGVGLLVAARYIMPRLGKMLASSSELLFLFSIGWGLSVSSLFYVAGFSHELGALFAGVSLAGLPYATEMAAKLKPLRDFFIVLFFVTLGEMFTFDAITQSIVPAIILSIIVMIAKPIATMAALGSMYYTRLTSFKAAIHLSQISEFSIILIIFAASHSVVQAEAVPIITMVALITIGISTYLMKYDDELYKLLDQKLKIFERSITKEKRGKHENFNVILFGYHKGGHEFLQAFREMKERYLVVDYNPEIIEHLEEQGIRHAFGDMTDEEFLDEIGTSQAELVVSTLDELDSNLFLLRYIRRHNQHVGFVCHAVSYEDAAKLYEHGASYVSLPHYIGSERIGNFIKRHGLTHKKLSNYRDRHLITIGKRAVISEVE